MQILGGHITNIVEPPLAQKLVDFAFVDPEKVSFAGHLGRLVHRSYFRAAGVAQRLGVEVIEDYCTAVTGMICDKRQRTVDAFLRKVYHHALPNKKCFCTFIITATQQAFFEGLFIEIHRQVGDM